LIILFLLALVLRLGYVLFFPWDMAGRKLDQQKIYQDERRYDSVATHLLAGEGFVNSADIITVVPPVYPLFLAGVYWVFGHSFTAVSLIQAIISALTCVVIYYIGRAAFNNKVGHMAALLAVAYPFFFVWCRVLVTETLMALLVALGVLWLQKTTARPDRRNRIVTGCIWGTAALMRGNMLIFLPLLILWSLLEFGLSRKALRIGGSIVFVAGLLLIPWTVRNYLEYRKPVLVASYVGYILYSANNPYSLPYEAYDTQKQIPEPEIIEWFNEKPLVETDSYLLKRGIRYIIDHPRTFLWSAYGRLTVFWRPVTLDTVQKKLTSAEGFVGATSLAVRVALPFLKVADGFVLSLAFLGLFLGVHKRRARSLYITVLALSAVHLVATVVGNGRFRLPLMPILAVFAGNAIYAMVELPRSIIVEQRPRVPRAWIVLVFLGVLSIPVGRALGLGNELRPTEGPPYEAESFEGVHAPPDGDYTKIAQGGWTYHGDRLYSGGHAALTAAVDTAIQQHIDKLSPGNHKLLVTIGGDPDEIEQPSEINRLKIDLNGVSRILEWSNAGRAPRKLGVAFSDVPEGNALSFEAQAIGGRFLVVDKVELAEP
jgi:4-amino-4-deoxy-L-arabinose transferase-like glycosyltransferase